jgi:hypothetical protein
MKTKAELIGLLEETVAYYNSDPERRGIDYETGDCHYLTEDNQMCAVGRCMTDKALEELGDVKGSYPDLKAQANRINIELFKEQYRGFPFQLWVDLQLLHDSRDNWDSVGITKKGVEIMGKIRELIRRGYYHSLGFDNKATYRSLYYDTVDEIMKSVDVGVSCVQELKSRELKLRDDIEKAFLAQVHRIMGEGKSDIEIKHSSFYLKKYARFVVQIYDTTLTLTGGQEIDFEELAREEQLELIQYLENVEVYYS